MIILKEEKLEIKTRKNSHMNEQNNTDKKEIDKKNVWTNIQTKYISRKGVCHAALGRPIMNIFMSL